MKTETNREIAERISQKVFSLGYGRVDCRDAIEAALNDERERCAKIADERAAFNTRLRDQYKQIHPRLSGYKEIRREEAETIAAEIRGHDPREDEEALRQSAMEDDEREREPNRW